MIKAGYASYHPAGMGTSDLPVVFVLQKERPGVTSGLPFVSSLRL
jgi:hypothetical protein